MNVSGAGAASGGVSLTAAPKKSSEDATQQFLDYMKETPAQRMEDAWLGQHGVTRQQFNAMSPAEKQKLMDEMKREIKEQLKQQTEKPKGPAGVLG